MKVSVKNWALALSALTLSIAMMGCDEQKIDLSKFKKPGMSTKAPAPPPMPGSTAGAPDGKDGKAPDGAGKDGDSTKPGADPASTPPAATPGK